MSNVSIIGTGNMASAIARGCDRSGRRPCSHTHVFEEHA